MSSAQSVSYVKTHLAEVLQEVNQTRAPLVVTQNGASTAVIIDHETYQRTRRALLMLKLVAMGEADAAKGRVLSQAEVFGPLKKRLRARVAAEAKAMRKP